MTENELLTEVHKELERIFSGHEHSVECVVRVMKEQLAEMVGCSPSDVSVSDDGTAVIATVNVPIWLPKGGRAWTAKCRHTVGQGSVVAFGEDDRPEWLRGDHEPFWDREVRNIPVGGDVTTSSYVITRIK